MRLGIATLSILFVASAFSGCIDLGPTTDGVPLGSASTPGACGTLSHVTLLEWTGPVAPQTSHAQAVFPLEAGARDLRIEWTEPTATAWLGDLRLSSPDGGVLFERAVASVSAGSNLVVRGATTNGPHDVEWPLSGDYVLDAEFRGAAPGARLLVTAGICVA